MIAIGQLPQFHFRRSLCLPSFSFACRRPRLVRQSTITRRKQRRRHAKGGYFVRRTAAGGMRERTPKAREKGERKRSRTEQNGTEQSRAAQRTLPRAKSDELCYPPRRRSCLSVYSSVYSRGRRPQSIDFTPSSSPLSLLVRPRSPCPGRLHPRCRSCNISPSTHTHTHTQRVVGEHSYHQPSRVVSLPFTLLFLRLSLPLYPRPPQFHSNHQRWYSDAATDHQGRIYAFAVSGLTLWAPRIYSLGNKNSR